MATVSSGRALNPGIASRRMIIVGSIAAEGSR
jgi:hypothetical protein